jgi:hypothetical protein
MLKGVASGLRLLFNKDIKAMVRPIGKETFHKYRYLKHHEPLRMEVMQKTSVKVISAFVHSKP